jgi:hypothetical protein
MNLVFIGGALVVLGPIAFKMIQKGDTQSALYLALAFIGLPFVMWLGSLAG